MTDSLDSSWVDVSEETIGTKDRHHSGGSGVEVEDSFVVVPESLTFAKNRYPK
ncbi:hypothetical protein [Wolbachia endosymbiont (group A) of Beris morrisii]|uniref:hypothetical protein n=1 Tax=Wolbachia endosymbiont (group A) of Beris morrisii TaxID=3066139 RepID=UPI0033419F7C